MDNIMDICTRFKTTDFQNRANIVNEFKGMLDVLRADIRRCESDDSIVNMEFSLRDGKFENVITDTYNIITNPSRRLITGIQALNEMLGGGFESSRFYLIMGTSGVGKSLTLLNLIYQMKKNNTHVKPKDPTKIPCIVLLTMENTIVETITRLFDLAIEGSIGMENYTCEDVIRLLRTEGQLVLNDTSPIDIYIKYKPNKSVDTSYLYTLYDDLEDQGYEMICLVQDHLKRIRSIYRNQDTRLELGDVVNEMKAFAAEKDIPVLSNSHLNREATRVSEEMTRKGTADIAKSLGQANAGESMLIVDNSDFIVMIGLDADSEGNRYMGFHRVKMRGKPIVDRPYFAQPFVPGSKIRLVEDIGGIPQFKETLHNAIGNNTIIKVSGTSNLNSDSIESVVRGSSDGNDEEDSLFNDKRAIYQPILIETEEERRAKAIKPVSFMNVTGDLDILNAIDELNKITEAV
jgi:RecA/RadA recombinase